MHDATASQVGCNKKNLIKKKKKDFAFALNSQKLL